MIDAASHPVPKTNVKAAIAELKAVGNLTLQPGIYNTANLIAIAVLGIELPPPAILGLAVAAAVGWAAHRYHNIV